MPALFRDPLTDKVGIWGTPTSTLDWCEENYVVTKYVAEFWNTVTNYFMVVPPLFAAVRCHQLGYDTRFLLSFLSFMGIGVGSTLFHATLQYKMQEVCGVKYLYKCTEQDDPKLLLDELPMIYCTYIILYCVLACDNEPRKRNFRLKFFLTLFSIVVTVIYIVFVNPLIFQWVYGLSVAVLIILTIYTARKHKVSQRFSFWAFVCYGMGFILWNIDNVFCVRVRYIRALLPWPFDALGQLHGWWHCLAAFGGYFQILYTIDLYKTCIKNKRKSEQNGSHQNGGIDIQPIGRKAISSSVFRDLWCWIPVHTRRKYDAEYGVNNNVMNSNGSCKHTRT